MERKKTVVFLGTSAFAVPSLTRLLADSRFAVTHVITQPDRPVGRKQILSSSPVKLLSTLHGIPVLQPEKINAAWGEIMPSIPRPDFLIVVSYGQILSQAILDFPLIAAINVHASLLPKYRGASPIQHAILSGDKETGVTIQKMVAALDAGAVLSQEKTPIDERETTPSLHDRLALLGSELLADTLSSPLTETPQDESKVTTCGKLTRADGIIDPKAMRADTIDRMIRALTPWPGVTLGDAKILSASLEQTDHAIHLSCAENTVIHITSIQPAGGKPMSGKDYERGRIHPSFTQQ